jgi:hypothetical protein
MSNSLFDLNMERGREQMARATKVLFDYLMKRNQPFGEMQEDVSRPKTCLSCGSSTQPCCGH